MLPGFDFINFAQTAGTWAAVLVLALIIFAESGLLVGFFLPGDSLLFTAGVLVNAGILTISVHLLALIAFAAAAIGDSVGYNFGRKLGPRLFNRPNSRLFRQENLTAAKKFYEDHGNKTIVIARFVPVVRTFAPIVAGAANMHYRSFLAYNLLGASLWGAGVLYLGYYAGALLERLGINIETVLLPTVALILVVSSLPALIHIFGNKNRRQAVITGIKKEIRTLLKR